MPLFKKLLGRVHGGRDASSAVHLQHRVAGEYCLPVFPPPPSPLSEEADYKDDSCLPPRTGLIQPDP